MGMDLWTISSLIASQLTSRGKKTKPIDYSPNRARVPTQSIARVEVRILRSKYSMLGALASTIVTSKSCGLPAEKSPSIKIFKPPSKPQKSSQDTRPIGSVEHPPWLSRRRSHTRPKCHGVAESSPKAPPSMAPTMILTSHSTTIVVHPRLEEVASA